VTPALLKTATSVTPEVSDAVDGLFTYQKWNDDQIARGGVVRAACANAVKSIIEVVPPGQARERAIANIVDARMQANAQITFGPDATT
jgi:hypothetical protein